MAGDQSNRDEQEHQKWQHSSRSLQQTELTSHCKMDMRSAGAVLKPVGLGGKEKRLVKIMAPLGDS